MTSTGFMPLRKKETVPSRVRAVIEDALKKTGGHDRFVSPEQVANFFCLMKPRGDLNLVTPSCRPVTLQKMIIHGLNCWFIPLISLEDLFNRSARLSKPFLFGDEHFMDREAYLKRSSQGWQLWRSELLNLSPEENSRRSQFLPDDMEVVCLRNAVLIIRIDCLLGAGSNRCTRFNDMVIDTLTKNAAGQQLQIKIHRGEINIRPRDSNDLSDHNYLTSLR